MAFLIYKYEGDIMATKQNKKEIKEIIEPKNIWLGNPGAPVSLVMYGDYESKACAKAHKAVKKLLSDYEGKVKFNFRHFPLTQVNQHSHKAAEASVGASQEGKFAAMHELLFENQHRLGTVSLKQYAREAGVTDKNFLPKLVESTYGWTVRTDLLDGLRLGVRDVPTFFINDEMFEGKASAEKLSKAIKEALKTSKRKEVA
jgi:protein-disulfide isomerase